MIPPWRRGVFSVITSVPRYPNGLAGPRFIFCKTGPMHLRALEHENAFVVVNLTTTKQKIHIQRANPARSRHRQRHFRSRRVGSRARRPRRSHRTSHHNTRSLRARAVPSEREPHSGARARPRAAAAARSRALERDAAVRRRAEYRSGGQRHCVGSALWYCALPPALHVRQAACLPANTRRRRLNFRGAPLSLSLADLCLPSDLSVLAAPGHKQLLLLSDARLRLRRRRTQTASRRAGRP